MFKQMSYSAVGMNKGAAFHQRGYKDCINILVMKTSDSLRYGLIKSVMALHQEKDAADAAINLWERTATQIISIVGEGGFNSLYARSVHLGKSEFPWLAGASLLLQSDSRFAELKKSFEGQTPAQVNEAHNLLMITFTDILASIIGEQLTLSILRSAWDNDASNRSLN